jgi:hypothetical protein
VIARRVLGLAALVVACSTPKPEGERTAPSAAPSDRAGAPATSAEPQRAAAAPSTPPSAPGPSAAASDGTTSYGELRAPAKACRAISVKGDVHAEGGKLLTTGAVLDRPTWLELGKGGELVVKHAETTRELVFRGPGRVLPCDRGEERFFVTRGRVETTTWAGARPGAEVLLATPYAAVTYGDAKLDLRVDERGLVVRVSSGDAWLEGGAKGEAAQKVPAGKEATRRGPPQDVKALVAECGRAATESEARARDVLSPPSGAAPLGTRAAEHVRARKAARAACAVALAALGSAATDEARGDLREALGAAEARWRGVPSPLRK